eukprot:9681215-Karenia_brevis.AAC.1
MKLSEARLRPQAVQERQQHEEPIFQRLEGLGSIFAEERGPRMQQLCRPHRSMFDHVEKASIHPCRQPKACIVWLFAEVVCGVGVVGGVPIINSFPSTL